MPLQHVRSNTANKRPVATNLADGQLAVNYHTDSPGIYVKDSNNALFKVGPIHVGSTAPNASPAGSSGNSKGEAWLDTSGANSILKVWNGTAWATVQPITTGTVVASDTNGNINVTSINSGPMAGYRNAILNGDFLVAQRGTSFANPAHAAYVMDRWQVSYNGTGATRTIERVAHSVGQTDVPGNPGYMLRWNQSVAGSGATFTQLVHSIEGVSIFAGTQVTFSFYARATGNITLPSIVIAQSFGTGGSPSANVNTTIASNVAVTTSWQRFSYTFTMPSISGKTLGTDANDKIAPAINLPLNAVFSIDISDVQLEPGPVATPYERLPFGLQRDVLCARYYQTRLVRVNTAASPPVAVSFSPRMRATPVITGGGAGLVLYAGSDRGFGATQTSANDEIFTMVAEF